MTQTQDPGDASLPAQPARRNFLSLSLLAGSSLLLAADSHGQTPVTQNDEQTIAKNVGVADSIALYTDLLEDARRVVLQSDAHQIYVAKYEATEWLGHTTSDAGRLRSMLQTDSSLTDQQKSELKRFLSDVDYGGNEITKGLIRMRQEPLQEIKDLDADFDSIRAQLTAASNAIKEKNRSQAKEGLTAAIGRLSKYSNRGVSYPGPEAGNPPLQPRRQVMNQRPIEGQAQQQVLIDQPSTAQTPVYKLQPLPQSTLIELLKILVDLLNEGPVQPADQHHASTYAYASYAMFPADPLLQSGINSVLRNRLKPASWLQVGIGYAVTFPILLRVSDKTNRKKLLNDALRLVPPGLRSPLLDELASDLADLP